MECLQEHGGEATVNELEEELDVGRDSIYRALYRLQRRNEVEKDSTGYFESNVWRVA